MGSNFGVILLSLGGGAAVGEAVREKEIESIRLGAVVVGLADLSAFKAGAIFSTIFLCRGVTVCVLEEEDVMVVDGLLM